MDLREKITPGEAALRHPWEISRLNFVKSGIQNLFPDEPPSSILDVGAGDGYVAASLKEVYPDCRVVGVDTALDWPVEVNGVPIHPRFEGLPPARFDLITMLDVIEHVDNDLTFVQDIALKYLSEGGYLVITVPMHPTLFSPHDEFLHHKRRYSMKQLLDLADKSSLAVVDRCQFFFSLLLMRCIEKMLPEKEVKGVGTWNRGKAATTLLAALLDLDWRLLSFLPGLSGYIVLSRGILVKDKALAVAPEGL